MRIVETSLPEFFTRCPDCKTELAYTDADVLFDIKMLSDKKFEQRRSINCCRCGELMVLGYDYIDFERK